MSASVTLKLATSLDGRIATATGESRWITGPEARQATHRLRSEHDAVLVGVETALADDPELTVRLPGWTGPQPARVVLDSRQRLADGCKLVAAAREIPTYLVSTTPPDPRLTNAGVRVLQVHAIGDDRPELRDVVATLAREGLERLFVEGGGQVAASFLRCGLVDRLEWFRAPIVIGGEGRPGIGALSVTALADAPKLRRLEVLEVGADLWERYERI
ncbi:RibD family protein [Phenylobacterium sp. LH3H17]|uniref:RibD family protein n=1 Tax=Phenylobacterium sp. LH3H17 TaxID=2903901 RepID=UPI0020C9CBD4|nr:RibD family protein [Phenylobacterium sp. LH3H17]UTP37831.1 RibD family protein [Phenylobacterium sp. LH3H17]